MSESQNKKVLQHLQKFGEITIIEAITKYYITRLSARIYDLTHGDKGCPVCSISKHRIPGKPYIVYKLERVVS